MKKYFVIATGALFILLASAAIWYTMPQRKSEHSAPPTTEKVAIGGAFELVDVDNKPIHDNQFRNKYMLVYFGFSYCPDVCPMTLDTLGEVLSKLGEEGNDKLQTIFITLDPSRDTPETLKHYMVHFHPRIMALTGSQEQIEAAIAAYKIYVAKAQGTKESDANYLLDHSSFVYFMDPEGKYITHFHHDIAAEAMVDVIKEAIQP
jgi:cytochrome oxidase Cu insertion factor (SCO1/SenC/PrrC family)